MHQRLGHNSTLDSAIIDRFLKQAQLELKSEGRWGNTVHGSN
jgi:hypothetical protein